MYVLHLTIIVTYPTITFSLHNHASPQLSTSSLMREAWESVHLFVYLIVSLFACFTWLKLRILISRENLSFYPTMLKTQLRPQRSTIMISNIVMCILSRLDMLSTDHILRMISTTLFVTIVSKNRPPCDLCGEIYSNAHFSSLAFKENFLFTCFQLPKLAVVPEKSLPFFIFNSRSLPLT